MPERQDWNSQIILQFRAKAGKDIGPFGDNLLLLTSTGAKSGEPRVNPLAFTRDGDRYVIVGSKQGAPSHPDWYYNLRRHPLATVEVGSEKFLVRSHEVKGEKRDELYRAHAARLPGFKEYEEKTTRVIPVFVLERVD